VLRDGRAHCALGALPYDSATTLTDGPARVLLRPEQLRLGAPGPRETVARVAGVDFYGHDSRAWLDLPGGIRVSARLDGADLPAAGDDVSVTVRGTALAFAATGAPEPAVTDPAPVPARLA
jgi:iron(III) transport system ATP-binding protein